MAITESPFTIVAGELKDLIETEFAAEQYKVRLDKLHESLGTQKVDIGIAPESDTAWGQDINTNLTTVEIRFYLPWKKEISPNTTVDPSKITIVAERMKDAIRRRNEVRNGLVWFYTVDNVRYVDDPTGNKTRFHATITATGNNTTYLRETVA